MKKRPAASKVSLYLMARSAASLPRARGRGEPLASSLAGASSLAVGLVDLLAILGLAPIGSRALVRPMVVNIYNVHTSLYVSKMKGSWSVPEPQYWIFAGAGVLLAIAGVALSRRRGVPITSLIGLGLNGLLYLLGCVLIAFDEP